jgi:hypothetical protein
MPSVVACAAIECQIVMQSEFKGPTNPLERDLTPAAVRTRIRMMSRFWRAEFACALALSVASWAFAGCLPDDPRSAEDMACCQQGDHDCGPAMRAADCCGSNSPADARFLPTKPAPTVKPVIAYIATVVPGDQLTRTFAGARLEPSVASSPPHFLLVTSLRI